MLKMKVLVVGPPALAQIIGHLFRERPELEVVGTMAGLRNLTRNAERLLPELIVATVKPVGTDVGKHVTSIKRCSPSSRLILVCPIPEFMGKARSSGADAFLDQEQLVSRLVPTVLALVGQQSPEHTSSHRQPVCR